MASAPMQGSGTVAVASTPARVWTALLDPAVLQSLIPGAETVERLNNGRYRAVLSYGVGKLRGRYTADITISDAVPGRSLVLAGQSAGPFGGGGASADVAFSAVDGGTEIGWSYAGAVTGLYAFVPATLLRAAGERFIGRFFTALGQRAQAGLG